MKDIPSKTFLAQKRDIEIKLTLMNLEICNINSYITTLLTNKKTDESACSLVIS
jgi:hypothetical protein